MPDLWHQELTRGLKGGKPDLTSWWQVFNDPVLEGLIERASKRNLELRTAAARIRGARASLVIAAGRSWPQIDGTGEAEYFQPSEQVPDGKVFEGESQEFYSLGLDASWELDVFGGIRRDVQAAEADIHAAIEDFRDILVILFADVARNYVEVRALQARLGYARANVELQRETLELTRNRFQATLVPELDVRQAELNLAITESRIPTLQSLLAQAAHRLSVLLGEQPGPLLDELAAAAPIPAPPGEIVIGLPAQLLRQRPDIRRAERRIAAETARIGVLTADLYPRFFLNGTLSLEANRAANFFDASTSHAYSFGPAFRWNLFAGGRIQAAIIAQDARTQQANYQYEQTVLVAVQEVESALAAFQEERDRRDALARSAEAARLSVGHVRVLYRTGLTDFLNVLDMQRSLSQQEDLLAESEGLVVQNLVTIYRALGGGWAPAANALARDSAPPESPGSEAPEDVPQPANEGGS
jgi:NodT family efflux transporter outer membrane factor (OMF) lipoprotein